MKKKIFICSPYRGRVEENKKKAVSYARITAMSGDVPIVVVIAVEALILFVRETVHIAELYITWKMKAL